MEHGPEKSIGMHLVGGSSQVSSPVGSTVAIRYSVRSPAGGSMGRRTRGQSEVCALEVAVKDYLGLLRSHTMSRGLA